MAASSVVTHGTPACTAAARILPPSVRALFAARRVDDERDGAIGEVVEQIRLAFDELLHAADRNVRRFERIGRAAGGEQ